MYKLQLLNMKMPDTLPEIEAEIEKHTAILLEDAQVAVRSHGNIDVLTDIQERLAYLVVLNGAYVGRREGEGDPDALRDIIGKWAEKDRKRLNEPIDTDVSMPAIARMFTEKADDMWYLARHEEEKRTIEKRMKEKE